MNNKSDRNFETAEWAENKQYFDVAISRYYYSVYQKMLYLLNHYNLDKNFQGKNCHKDRIKYFEENIVQKQSLDDKEFKNIQKITTLRKIRNDVDYLTSDIDASIDVFNKKFKFLFNGVHSTLNKIIERSVIDNGKI